jgi:hypothetical protein
MNPHPYLAGILLLTATAVSADELFDASLISTIRTEHISVPGIQRVVIETPGDLEIRPGTAAQLTIEAEPHVLRKLDNTSQQSTLILRSKGSFTTTRNIRYVLEIPKLRSLTARGSGNIQIGGFKGDAFDLELAGNGDATVKDAAYRHLDLRISGSGNIAINGRGETLTAAVSGVGNIRAENLAVTTAEATITGAGDIHLQAAKQLKSSIAGSGSIRYKGHPQIAPAITGAGSIKPL